MIGLVDVFKHQFSVESRDLKDLHEEYLGAPNEDFAKSRVGVNKGLMTLFTERRSGLVPVSLELLDAAPQIDLDWWSSAVEASIHHEGHDGGVCCRELATGTYPLEIPLTGNVYQTLVLMGGLDSAPHDATFGADHYRILLWPGEERPVRIAKAFERVTGRRTKALIDQDRCLSALESNEVHARLNAMLELARHGTPEALSAIQVRGEKSNVVVERYMAARSQAVGSEPALRRLMTYLGDTVPVVRRAAVEVVGEAIADVEAGRAAKLDAEAAYDFLNFATADPVEEISELATNLLADIRSIAKEPRAKAKKPAKKSKAKPKAAPPPPPEPEPPAGQPPALEIITTRLIEALASTGDLDLVEGSSPGDAARSIVDKLRSPTVDALYDALLNCDEIDEVYCDAEGLGETMERLQS